jgi:hypothetical protein
MIAPPRRPKLGRASDRIRLTDLPAILFAHQLNRLPPPPTIRKRPQRLPAAVWSAPLYRSTENWKTVVCWYTWPGLRTVEGKFGWFGESG